MVYIVSREVGTFHHGQTLLLSESGIVLGAITSGVTCKYLLSPGAIS